MKLLLSWFLLLGVAAGQGAVYGTIKGDAVRLRGGPGEAHPVLGQFAENAILRSIGAKGRWLEVEVPGGFPVYVSTGTPERPYLRDVNQGQAVVTASDLLIRPYPSAEGGSLGRLQPGDRVIVIDEVDGFTRIYAPDKVEGYVYDEFFAPAADQQAARVQFEEQHRASRRALLASGSRSRIWLEQEEARERYEAMVSRAFDRFDEESRKAWEERDTGALRAALDQLIVELPAGHGSRGRAERMIGVVDEWDRQRSEVLDQRRQIEEQKRKAAVAEAEYQRRLEEIRRRHEEKGAEGGGDGGKPYVVTGRVNRSVPVGQQVLGTPAYSLWQGGKRVFYLESSRYDLSEYQDRLVGILEAEGPMERPGLGFRVYRIVRMEVLERHRDEEKLGG